MDKKSVLVSVGTCWNERVYLQNLIPQLLKVSSKVLLVDDFSTDGTKEYIESLNDPRIEFYQRKFTICAEQFDFILQKAPKDNTWIYCFTADELLNKFALDNMRIILDVSDKHHIDRVWQTVWHLRNEREMSQEVGGEIRLFRNEASHGCTYVGYPHERLHGKFAGHCLTQPNESFGFVHFKQADKGKVQDWKTDYVEKEIYSLRDVNRRLNFPNVKLPDHVQYYVNDELRRHLGWL